MDSQRRTQRIIAIGVLGISADAVILALWLPISAPFVALALLGVALSLAYLYWR